MTEPKALPPVQPCSHCGARCFAEGIAPQRCWGEVSAIEEDMEAWVHACEGHREYPDATHYTEPYL